MGDASWVLLAGDPVLTLQLKGLLVVTGAVTGYAVDARGIAPRRRATPCPPEASMPVGGVHRGATEPMLAGARP